MKIKQSSVIPTEIPTNQPHTFLSSLWASAAPV